MNESQTWIYLYNLWIKEGDLKVLLYLKKIQRYLSRGRAKSRQERWNLLSQIEAMIKLPYQGEYQYLRTDSSCTIDINIFKPTGPIRLPDHNSTSQIADFLQNSDGIRIKPQNTDQFCTHPLWILWTLCDSDNDLLHCAIWMYREVFFDYMYKDMYYEAAQVYQHCIHMKVRKQELPLWHPLVLKHIMYVNIDKDVKDDVEYFF